MNKEQLYKMANSLFEPIGHNELTQYVKVISSNRYKETTEYSVIKYQSNGDFYDEYLKKNLTKKQLLKLIDILL